MQTVEESKILNDTIEISAIALVELLEGVSTHAGRDKSLPTLNAVQIESERVRGYLIARATDRYRLIEGEIEIEYGQLSPSLIRLEDVKRVVAIAKEGKAGKVSLNRVGDLLTVSAGGNLITLTLLDGTFPPTADLFAKSEGEPVAVKGVAFNPALMADYVKIAGKGEGIKIYFTGEGKPMRVRITGDKVTWKALLMPMRYTD